MPHHATALIAEDEPLLAAALQAELARAWPGLQVLATVGHGRAAVQQALALRPQVVFLDIRMPGMSGLEAAAELADAWPAGDGAPPFPAIVFVTAYDQYAVQAFEAQAVDYLLKPVMPERLARTVQRVQQRLRMQAAAYPPAPATAPLTTRSTTPVSARAAAPVSALPSAPDTAPAAMPLTALEQALDQLRALLAPGALSAPGTDSGGAGSAAVEPLRVIQASVGNQLRLLPVDEVLVFEAADKYLRVLTADAEVLIRTPLKELLPQLDAGAFWQVHRGTVVRASAIDTVHRDEAGRLSLRLRGRPETWPVSRLYAQRFRAM